MKIFQIFSFKCNFQEPNFNRHYMTENNMIVEKNARRTKTLTRNCRDAGLAHLFVEVNLNR